MPDSPSDPVPSGGASSGGVPSGGVPSGGASLRRVPPRRRSEPLQRLLFGGVYGTVLASTLASALGHDSGPADPGYDVVWVLLGALTSAMAHGYAHAIAHQVADHAPITANAVRSMLTEWPLVVAVLPTAAALLGAYVGWWGENAAINFALTLNTVALFGWGLWAARVAGRGWPASCRAGGVDLLLGLVIVGANALSH